MESQAVIAVIDDETDILELYKNILGDLYEVIAFDSPQSFLEQICGPNPPAIDLVITDLKLPGINGLEMIRKAQQAGIFFPFIMLSGYLDKQVVIDAVDVGVFRLLEKPTEFETLLAAIDQLLLEHKVYKVRREINEITSQLRELYSAMHLVLSQHLPKDVIERLIVDAPGGQVKRKISFEMLLDQLERRLDSLLKTESIISELKINKFKS